MKALPGAAEALVERVTVDVAAGAAARAPIDTGNLAQSYTPEVDGINGTAGSNVEYAPYVEYGTFHSGAQPHLVPAADEVDNNMGMYAKDFKAKLEEAARSGSS
jgi:hypothetical protein